MAVVVFLLPLTNTPALGIQFQLAELPLMVGVHSLLRRQDRVEIVALPLHPVLVKVSAVLHGDELCVKENADTFYYGVPGHACLVGDGVVAGMAGVCPAILDQQQVGVDHERGRRKVQQKYFIRQSEKLSVISELGSRSKRELIGDEFHADHTGQILFHGARRHVDGFSNSFRGNLPVIVAVGMAAAEIGQDHKLNRLELVFPYRIGKREAVVAWVTPEQADRNAMPSH